MSNGLINRQYVGARYVPKIMGEWNKALQYEALSVVTYMGNSFTSKVAVPANIEITNEDYWVNTGNYNAQVEEYRKATEDKIMYFNTVKEMKESTKIKNGQVVTTLGYYNINDGGGATYKIRNTVPNVFYETINSNLYGELISDTPYNVLQLGIRQNIDQTEALTNILLKTDSLYFPQGTYIFNIVINRTCAIIGDGIERTIFKPNTNEAVIKLNLVNPTYHSKFKDFCVYGNNKEPYTGKGIELTNETLTLSEFTNLAIGFFEYGFYSNGSNYSNNYTNVHFSNCEYGFYHPLYDHTFNNNQFNFCHFNGNSMSAITISTPLNLGMTNYFYGCDIEGNCSKGRIAIDINGLSNTEFNACYFERNGRGNSNFLQTIYLYNASTLADNYKLNTSFISCNFTQEKTCIKTNFGSNITLIECIENVSEGENFIVLDDTSYVNYIGGNYTHVSESQVLSNMYETWIEPNQTKALKTMGGVIYVLTAYSAGEKQMLEFLLADGTVNTLYKSEDGVGIKLQISYTDNKLKISNSGTSGTIVKYKIL